MSADRHLPLSPKSIVAVVLVLVCVLFLMSWANVAFRGLGVDFVYYASRIVGLPVLFALVWLVVHEHRVFLRRLFARAALTWHLVLTAVVVGVLARIVWWSQLTGRIAFGRLDSVHESPPQSFTVGFSCPEPVLLAMAIVVWWFLVPLVEEFVHRGVLMSAFSNRGPVLAVANSALIFAVMHRPGSFPLVLAYGVVFGIFFWNTRTLWAPIIAHATYDGLLVVDWICLKTSWNPATSDLPLTGLGIASAVVGVACLTGIAYLISTRWVGSPVQSNPT